MIRLLLALLLLCSPALAGGYEGTPTPGAGSPSPIGPQGDPGCSVLPTHGPPSVSYGLVCDWAFDAGAGAVYGPKTTGGWGAPLVMTPVQQAQTQAALALGSANAAAISATNAGSSASAALASASGASTSATAAAASDTDAATQATNAAASASAASSSASGAATAAAGLLSSNETVGAHWTFSNLPIFTSCTGYLYGNGASAPTCATSIAASVISGLFNGSLIAGDCLKWSSSGIQDAGAACAGAVVSVTCGAGLTGGVITGSGTCAVDYSARPVAVRQTVTSGPTIYAGAVSISIATPAVVSSWSGPPVAAGTPVVFSTSGALPTGLTAATVYYVSLTGLTSTSFSVSTSLANALAGTNIATSGSQSGTQTATIDTGLPTFLPPTSASLTLTTQNVTSSAPLIFTGWAGDISGSNYGPHDITCGLTSNSLSWTDTASNTNFNYATLSASGGACTVTPAVTTLVPVYQLGGTPSVANGQITCNIAQHACYLGNGTTAPQTVLVVFGESIAGSSAITSTAAYAYNGYYDSGWSAPLLLTQISKNSNIGVSPVHTSQLIQCVTTDDGFAVGDTIEVGQLLGVLSSRNVIGVSAQSSGFELQNKSTGTFTAITFANWKYKLTASRGW